MSGKKTLAWAVLLLALAAFYYVYEIQGGKTRRETARQQAQLLPFAVEAATGLTLKRSAEAITAVKRQGHWHLTAPLAWPGDDEKYRDLLRALADLRYERLLEAQPESLDAFGLTTPALEIQVQLEAQSQPLGLRLGDRNPTSSGYYAQVEGRATIYLVASDTKDTLDASLYDLRDKTVLPFDATTVQEIQLRSDTAVPIVLQRQDKDRWQMTAPVQWHGDEAQIKGLLQRLQQAKVQTFVADAPTDLEPYGLHAPVLRLSLRIGSDQTVKTLLFGNQDADKKGVYVKRHDTANVLLLPQQFWDDLPKTATALRDKTLLAFEREQIDRIEMQSPHEHIVITRTGPRQYRLQQPLQDAGDGDAILGLLWDLNELKATEFVAEAPDALAPYGLETPRLRITLSEAAAGDTTETRQHTLRIGDDVPDQQGTYVQLAPQPTVYLVASSEVKHIVETTAFDLRNKHLLAFETDAIQKIQVRYPTSAFTLERRGDTWKLSEPRQQTIQQHWKVDNLLYDLSTLEYARIIAETDTEAVDYGLEPPQVQITLWQEDGTPIGPLTVGRSVDAAAAETQLVYARTGATPLLYAVKAAFLDTVPKQPTDLMADN